MDGTDFIGGLPKAELHMHIEGSVEAETMLALARRNGVALRWDSVDALRAAYRFGNLQEFLNLYYDGCRVLVEAQDFYDVTRAYLRRAHADTVRHAEMFLGPQSHTERGVALATQLEGVLGAMDDARRDDGITSGLLVGAQRHRSEAEALQLFDDIQPWAGRILGFGLGGAEVGNPPAKFERFFARCRAAGFKVVAHAGEEGPADYVRESVVLLRIDRIDHGNACMSDPALVAQLAARGIGLTVCPLSNLRLQGVLSLDVHPLKAMLDAGLRATVNSDDPSYFGGYVNDNYRQCQQALGLTQAELVTLARNSFEVAFVPEAERAGHLAALDAYVARAGAAAAPH